MIFRGWALLTLISIPLGIMASGEDKAIGGRAAAMGGVSVTGSDMWSVVNNPAGLAYADRIKAGLFGDNNFLLKEISTMAAGIVIPLWRGGAGVYCQRYGFSLYNETRAALSYGMKLARHFSAGVQLDYLRFQIGEGYGSCNLFICSVGLQYMIRSRLTIGFHIYNPIMVRLTKDPEEKVPATFRLGLAWKLSPVLTTVIETEKELSQKPILKAGMEYQAAKPILVRIGFHSNPTTFTFGTGLILGKLEMDISSSYNLVLGYSPQVSLQYKFKK